MKKPGERKWLFGTVGLCIWLSAAPLSAQSKLVLTVNPPSLSFTLQAGAPPIPNPTLSVTSSGAPISFSASAATATGGNWLGIVPASNVATPTSLIITLNPSAVQPGSYSGSITLTSEQASNSPLIVPVTLSLAGTATGPQLNLNPPSLSFQFVIGLNAPPAQAVSVSSSGGALNFTALASATWLSVTPAAGTAPGNIQISANPAGLQPGTYNGSVVVSSPGAVNSPQPVSVALVVSTAFPSVQSVVNGGSFSGGPVAPGEIVSIFGSALGPAIPASLVVSSFDKVGTTVAGTSVFFDEFPAPLIYVSASQVSMVVPYGLAGRSTARLHLETSSAKSPEFDLAVAPTAPGVFTVNGTGSGAGAILNQDLSPNLAAHPVSKGGIILIYATGEGQTNPAGSDGYIFGSSLSSPLQNVTVTIGGRPADVLYAGSATGMIAGVLQVNARVPSDITGGSAVPVVVTIGQKSSQAGVTVAVQQ